MNDSFDDELDFEALALSSSAKKINDDLINLSIESSLDIPIKEKYSQQELLKIMKAFFPDLQFRKYQRETIIAILTHYQNDPTSKIIVDAPTGSGKSIIALVTSKILNSNFYGSKTGYILTSETFLQDQYESTVSTYKLNMPSVKGKDRYDCTENKMPISLGYCTEKVVKGSELRNLPCYSECPYFSRRDAAALAKTSILNYSYWLLQHNYVSQKTTKPLFEERDFVFFDEAHKVVSIVNNHFSPRIGTRLANEVKKISQWYVNDEIQKVALDIEDEVAIVLIGSGNDEKSLKVINNSLIPLLKLKDTFEAQRSNGKVLSESDKKIIRSFDFIYDVHCKLQDFLKIVNGNFKELCVRSASKNEVAFFCLDEGEMMLNMFHKFYKFGVYMSATFLNHDFFAAYSKLYNIKIIKIPSTFDFTESPIFYTRDFDMSFKNKKNNQEAQAHKIKEIIEKYESGVIHTGSFSNSFYLKDFLGKQKKVKFYETTEEKIELISQLKKTKDFFIAGPSLLEGIDMTDDLSRCQIFMKIPYLNLGDEFTEKRFKRNKIWYLWESSLNFVQGAGRSNRHETDWCHTYILDSTFSNLVKANMIPDFIKNRIRMI